MPEKFQPIKLTDLKLSLDDAKLIADGAAVFSALPPDPEDSERLFDTKPEG